MKSRLTHPLKILIILSLSLPTLAAKWQSLETVQQTAVQYLQSEIGEVPDGELKITVGHLDQRLHLQDCTTGLEAFLPPGQQASQTNVVGIRCQGSRPWSVYVPVRVAVIIPVLTAKRSLQPGRTIRPGDLATTQRNRNRLQQGYFSDPSEVVGLMVKRNVRAGAVLLPNYVDKPIWVKRGQPVTILAKTGSVEVKVSGVALGDGREGDLVKVRNKDSKRVVEAWVKGPQTVQINL